LKTIFKIVQKLQESFVSAYAGHNLGSLLIGGADWALMQVNEAAATLARTPYATYPNPLETFKNF
jgi:hypothetical protein